MWQKARIKYALEMDREFVGREIWVKAAPPHREVRLEPDGSPGDPDLKEMYDTNVVTQLSSRGCFGVEKGRVELLPEFAEAVGQVTYQDWRAGKCE